MNNSDYSGQAWNELPLTNATIDAIKVLWMQSGIGSGGFHEIELYIGQSMLSTEDDIFKFHEWKLLFYIRFSIKFVPNGPINNTLALVQIMGWCQTGDKLLFEPMMDQFNDAYICVARLRWIIDDWIQIYQLFIAYIQAVAQTVYTNIWSVIRLPQ